MYNRPSLVKRRIVQEKVDSLCHRPVKRVTLPRAWRHIHIHTHVHILIYLCLFLCICVIHTHIYTYQDLLLWRLGLPS